ncbi:unnamed protein product [Phaedon cochleariae]|uniref:Dynein axonemal intermediate chain 4 n=1 Tax=Phaedon cochleariae TaxID=80249 RepID=A0A9P0DI77_PHACE|nr:unnamed protein product [Phaedon cochleariae]
MTETQINSQKFQLRRKSLGSPTTRKPILISPKRKTLPLPIILRDGVDVTPKPLNPEIFTGGRERQLSVYDIGLERDRLETRASRSHSQSLNVFRTQSTVRFKPEYGKTRDDSNQYRGSVSQGSNFFDPIISDIEDEQASISNISVPLEPSKEIQEDRVKKIPSHISLILTETNTFFILDMPSCTAIKDTDEGNQVEEDNAQYEFLTEGKGKNRKTLSAEVQTFPIVMKTRSTFPEKVKTQTGTAFVSNWNMYDTYQATKETLTEESEESDEDSDFEYHKLDDLSSLDSYKLSADEKMMAKLMKNPRFLEAVCVIERLLANNCYNEEQKIFRALSVPDDFRENIEYKYKLRLLWTFSNDKTKGLSVNSVHWNPANKDICAVGYGKFYFHDNLPGLVMIWNIKNPVQPERNYSFDVPVTSVCFSSSNPILLAIGFYDGSIKVLNVVSRDIMIIGEKMPTYEPVWSVLWQYGRTERVHEELVGATFDDGRLCAYAVQRKLQEVKQMMRVAKADGKLKGYDVMKKCSNLTIPASRYSSALFARPHPVNNTVYFIGTNEGTIHKCSVNYLNQHLDIFLAHDGPVNQMKFSPFSNDIFATCGDDCSTRIWGEGISEPVLEFSLAMKSVEGFDWSPSHSTVIVTIQGTAIQIWDLQRKAYAPQSITESPTGSRNSVVQFTDSGRCLIVGDVDGYVHVFSLEDMPFPAFFQENLLFESIAKALVTNVDLLNKVKKLRRSETEEEPE